MIPVLRVDRHYRHDQAVRGNVPAIAQRLVVDFTHPRAVNQHAPDRRLAGKLHALGH